MVEEDGQVGAVLDVAEQKQRHQQRPEDHQQWEQARVPAGLRTHTHTRWPSAAPEGGPSHLQHRRWLTQRTKVVTVRPSQSPRLKVRKQQTVTKKRSEEDREGGVGGSALAPVRRRRPPAYPSCWPGRPSSRRR